MSEQTNHHTEADDNPLDGEHIPSEAQRRAEAQIELLRQLLNAVLEALRR